MRTEPTICLCMIVRNEAERLPRLFSSVAGQVDDIVIADTGSEDNTFGLACELVSKFEKEGVAHVFRTEFRDFSQARNEVMKAAAGMKAEYLLCLDADEELVATPGWKEELAADDVRLRYDGPTEWWNTKIVRNGMGFHYKEPVHEYLTCGLPTTRQNLRGAFVRHHADGGQSGRLRWERDLAALLARCAEEPHNARAAYYLAQTRHCLGQKLEASRDYARRAGMRGWEEEGWHAAYKAAVCACEAGEPEGGWVNAALAAWERRPTRIEPAVFLAERLNRSGRHRLAYAVIGAAQESANPEGDALFVETEAYAWRAQDQRALAAYYIGRKVEAAHAWQTLLEDGKLPEAERERVERNLRFAET